MQQANEQIRSNAGRNSKQGRGNLRFIALIVACAAALAGAGAMQGHNTLKDTKAQSEPSPVRISQSSEPTGARLYY